MAQRSLAQELAPGEETHRDRKYHNRGHEEVDVNENLVSGRGVELTGPALSTRVVAHLVVGAFWRVDCAEGLEVVRGQAGLAHEVRDVNGGHD
eukprot:scaffold23452_cov55-Phaeocystis_antarctica.AAC.3